MQHRSMTALLGAAAFLSLAMQPAAAQGTLRLGMTAADIPLTSGQPDNGGEGQRWIGYVLYDALVNWDLSQGEKPAALTPGLAESWTIDPEDQRKWTFKLRRGVTFHDGSAFNADAVVWNFDKLFKTDAPQYDARQASLVNFRITSFESLRKIDDDTVEFTTRTPDAYWPYAITYVFYSSPAQWAKTKDWKSFANEPSGTGPWKMTRLVPRERAELVANRDYWDPRRRPKLDGLVLMPIPDPAARTAAILSGQVDWIEAPAPDAIPKLKQSGMNIISNPYPHVWPYTLSFMPDSPFNDVRVRKAANLAIDRDGMVELLGGFAEPAIGHVQPDDPWFGHPAFKIKYDQAEAKKLLKEAGYGPAKPVKVKVLISASGSGQMQPLAMNEYVQQNLKDVGIEVEFVVLEWQSLLDRWRAGSKAPQSAGSQAINISYGTSDPFSAFTRFLASDQVAPNGVNWGNYNNAEMDDMLLKAKVEFDAAKQNAILAKVHEKAVDDALFLWVVHDTGPRALSPKVKGFVQAKSWYQDLTPVYLAK